jgi:hypothetical protein
MGLSGWIGVDLDGTLAEYHGWNNGKIGAPIPKMMERVNKWIAEGINVKIFTARASAPELISGVQDWLEENGLPRLEVTCVKDFAMIELWDDRCFRVEMNTGNLL